MKQPLHGWLGRLASGAAAVGLACGLAGATAVTAAPTECRWGPQCPYTEFQDQLGHYRISFPDPLIRLPPDEAQARRDNGQPPIERRASFTSDDGRFQLELWARPNTDGRRALDRPPPPGSVNDDGWRVTYRASGDTWTVSSGYTRTGHVFYERMDFMCGRSTLTGFVVVYPSDRASRARFDSWNGRLKIRSHACSAASASQ